MEVDLQRIKPASIEAQPANEFYNELSLHRTERLLTNAAKRLMDILASALVIALLSPLLILIGLLIRIDSPGPALFRQPRVGKDGKVFTCFKFRTMRRNADESVHRLAIKNMTSGAALSDNPNMPFKLTNDTRVTRVGSLLRRTSLDELPQLFNVLLGDMSLVGPRPAIPYELEHYKEHHHYRHSVKPGITGMWQVYGRGRAGFDAGIELDLRYASTWTLWLDLKLILLTLPVLLLQRGAR